MGACHRLLAGHKREVQEAWKPRSVTEAQGHDKGTGGRSVTGVHGSATGFWNKSVTGTVDARMKKLIRSGNCPVIMYERLFKESSSV